MKVVFIIWNNSLIIGSFALKEFLKIFKLLLIMEKYQMHKIRETSISETDPFICIYFSKFY